MFNQQQNLSYFSLLNNNARKNISVLTLIAIVKIIGIIRNNQTGIRVQYNVTNHNIISEDQKLENEEKIDTSDKAVQTDNYNQIDTYEGYECKLDVTNSINNISIISKSTNTDNYRNTKPINITTLDRFNIELNTLNRYQFEYGAIKYLSKQIGEEGIIQQLKFKFNREIEYFIDKAGRTYTINPIINFMKDRYHDSRFESIVQLLEDQHRKKHNHTPKVQYIGQYVRSSMSSNVLAYIIECINLYGKYQGY